MRPDIDRLRPCPTCSSHDIRWCGISVRPYCAECNTWGRTHYGSANDAVRDWNERSERADRIANALAACDD